MKEEPKFITSVMTDVNKASELILDRVDAQQINLGAQPYLIKNDPLAPMDPNEEAMPSEPLLMVRIQD